MGRFNILADGSTYDPEPRIGGHIVSKSNGVRLGLELFESRTLMNASSVFATLISLAPEIPSAPAVQANFNFTAAGKATGNAVKDRLMVTGELKLHIETASGKVYNPTFTVAIGTSVGNFADQVKSNLATSDIDGGNWVVSIGADGTSITVDGYKPNGGLLDPVKKAGGWIQPPNKDLFKDEFAIIQAANETVAWIGGQGITLMVYDEAMKVWKQK